MHPSEQNLLAKVFFPLHIRCNLVVPKEIEEKVRELEIVGMPFHGPASDNNARFRFANSVFFLLWTSLPSHLPVCSDCTMYCVESPKQFEYIRRARGAALRGCEIGV